MKYNFFYSELVTMMALRNINNHLNYSSINNNRTNVKEKTGVMHLLEADLETLDDKTAQLLKLDGGVIIKGLNSSNMRMLTGLRAGFIITRVDKQVIHSTNDLFCALEDKKKGGVILEGFYLEFSKSHSYVLTTIKL